MPEPDNAAENLERLKQMFSLSYFQSCVDYIKANGSLSIPRWGIAKEGHPTNYYLPDGSLIYDKKYQSMTVEHVREEAKEYNIDYHFTAYGHISDESKEIFEKLLCHLQAGGTRVDLFLCPMAPSLWDRCDEKVHFPLWETEGFAREMAEKYDLKIIGSYNPYEVGISDEEFYDSRHMRHEAIGKYFDFTE